MKLVKILDPLLNYTVISGCISKAFEYNIAQITPAQTTVKHLNICDVVSPEPLLFLLIKQASKQIY